MGKPFCPQIVKSERRWPISSDVEVVQANILATSRDIPNKQRVSLHLGMAIAIRRDAAEGNLSGLVKSYQERRRPYITMTCQAPECREEYLIYHEPSTEQAQLRAGFATYVERDHPNHPVMYEIDESTVGDPKITL